MRRDRTNDFSSRDGNLLGLSRGSAPGITVTFLRTRLVHFWLVVSSTAVFRMIVIQRWLFSVIMFRTKNHHSVSVPSLGKSSVCSRRFESVDFSLGLAYAGTNRDDVIELISNALREGSPSMEVECEERSMGSATDRENFVDHLSGLSLDRYHRCGLVQCGCLNNLT